MDGNGYESETDILAAVIHAIAFLVAIGYAQNYYFHLRESSSSFDVGRTK